MLLLVLLVAAGSVHANLDSMKPFSDEYINYINSIQNSWTAGRNYPENIDMKFFKNIYSLHPDGMKQRLPERKPVNLSMTLDKEFDARVHWPHCDTIKEIRDQGNCQSCWAVAPVEVMSDRVCIHSNTNKVVRLSSQELINCCDDCKNSKTNLLGYPVESWKYWAKYGLVTGGNYNDNGTCLPYTSPPCHWAGETCRACRAYKCTKKCQQSSRRIYKDDKYYGEHIYLVHPSEKEIMTEIMLNGPVQASIEVYGDFNCYKHGVYKHEDENMIGRHAVKIIGWGEEDEPYWLVANSQGKGFGDLGGFVKILRGRNECGIESSVYAGLPQRRFD